MNFSLNELEIFLKILDDAYENHVEKVTKLYDRRRERLEKAVASCTNVNPESSAAAVGASGDDNTAVTAT